MSSLFVRYGTWAAQGTPDLNWITAMMSLFSVSTTEVIWHKYEHEESITADTSMTVSVLWYVTPHPVSAINIESTPGQYGNLISIVFDINLSNASGQQSRITVVDSEDTSFTCVATALGSSNQWILSVADFNLAVGDMTVSYTDSVGGLLGENGQSTDNFSISFTPVNLGAVTAPVLEAIWNE